MKGKQINVNVYSVNMKDMKTRLLIRGYLAEVTYGTHTTFFHEMTPFNYCISVNDLGIITYVRLFEIIIFGEMISSINYMMFYHTVTLYRESSTLTHL